MTFIKKTILFLLILPSTLVMAQRLHEEHPAHYFEEAFVIGNGTLGGTIYSNTYCDRISLNDITLWTGEPCHEVFDSAANAKVLHQIRESLF